MLCPLCNKQLVDVYSKQHDPPIGWDCMTYVKGGVNGERTTHYSVRGARATVMLFPFKIDTWQVVDEYPGRSVVYHWANGWKQVWSCDAIPLTETDKLLARLKLLLIFS